MKKRALKGTIYNLRAELGRANVLMGQLQDELAQMRTERRRTIAVHFTEIVDGLIYRAIGQIDVRWGEQVEFLLPLETRETATRIRLEQRPT